MSFAGNLESPNEWLDDVCFRPFSAPHTSLENWDAVAGSGRKLPFRFSNFWLIECPLLGKADVRSWVTGILTSSRPLSARKRTLGC